MALIWTAYAGTYLLRKPLGVGKAAMGAGLNLSPQALGLFDVCMYLPYALVQTTMGWVPDRYGVRLTLSTLLAVSAASMVTFGTWTSLPILLTLVTINGAAQSLAWSCCIKATSARWEEPERSRAVGILATSSFAGGIIATALAVQLLPQGWPALFFWPSVILGGIAVLVFFGMRVEPQLSGGLSSGANSGPTVGGSALTTGQVLAIPMVPELSLVNLLCKLVRYAFYMWLPLYLSKAVGYDDATASIVAVSFEVGGVIGSGGLGYYKRRWFNDSDVVTCMAAIIVGASSLVMFSLTAAMGVAINCLTLALAGAGNCAIDAILSGTLAIKLAERSHPEATSQIAGA